ncbi:hypothetical protein BD777DRAFT_124768 [Yarrowia lipolytica]|nr:hypothetical protein BD777DRAFT_124768 [Yarrowia lipolytica]
MIEPTKVPQTRLHETYSVVSAITFIDLVPYMSLLHFTSRPRLSCKLIQPNTSTL